MEPDLNYIRSDPQQLTGRAVDPHSFYADPDPAPAVFLNADPDPDPGPGPAEPNLKRKKIIKSFLQLKKTEDCSKARNNGACAYLILKNLIKLQLLAISLHADPDPQPCNKEFKLHLQ